MDNRNAWTSSAMLSGLVLHGDRRKELQVFVAMVREGHEPVVAAYVGVLNACRRGLLEDGLRCFNRMRLEHKVTPEGSTTRALIGSMPTGPMDTAWRGLLNACRIHGDLDLAERPSGDDVPPCRRRAVPAFAGIAAPPPLSVIVG